MHTFQIKWFNARKTVYLLAAACVTVLAGCGLHKAAHTAGAPSAVVGVPAAAPAPRLAPVCHAPTGASDFSVTVTTQTGFVNGQPFVTRGTTSMNFSQEVVRRPDYIPKPDPATVGLLAALHPAYLRWIPGHDGQLYTWTRSPTESPLTSTSELSPALVDAFIAVCRAVNAEPFIAINFKTGSAEQAQDFVHYLNIEKHYGVKWVQIGNEPDLTTSSGLPNPVPLLPATSDQNADVEAYAQRFTQFRDAIHAVDPNIHVAGPEMMMGEDLVGFGTGWPEWLTPIMQRLGPQIDAISWHYYAKYSGEADTQSSIYVDPATPQTLLQENAADWPTGGMNYVNLAYPHVRDVRDTYHPKAQIWVDEFAEDPGIFI